MRFFWHEHGLIYLLPDFGPDLRVIFVVSAQFEIDGFGLAQLPLIVAHLASAMYGWRAPWGATPSEKVKKHKTLNSIW